MDNLGAVLLTLCVLSFLLFLLRVLLITCRSYATSQRLKEERGDTQVYYWSWYNGYVLYVVLVLMFVVALPLVAILSAKHKREAAARNLAAQRQRARRQMEINVTENGNGLGSSGGVSNVCMNTQDEVTVLPKTMDLPPSYDEAAFSERKQGSTLTIATTLEASNPNLAVGVNEPPPVYEPNVASTTTTTTTTTTFLVNGQPPVM